MAYLITRLCIDCLDRGCVEVCPVECIYELKEAPTAERPNMLYIHPTECISCAACEPECPWGAIFEDREVPDTFAQDAALNALTVDQPEHFRVGKPARDLQGRVVHKLKPTRDQVAENRRRWEGRGPELHVSDDGHSE